MAQQPGIPNAAGRLIAIGDIHGCGHALDALLHSIAPRPEDRLVFLGDLIDQGRESREVLERLIELRQECAVVLIQGNHEEMMLAARRYWEHCGGVSTLYSYRFGGELRDIPAEHWKLLEECQPYFETDRHIFTHAHYLPEVPMALQPGHELRWALFDPTRMQPHVSGKTVWLGHTEQVDGEIVDLGFAVCIDTACWRYGWLTAVEVSTRETWQASRWGILRDQGELAQHGRLTDVFRAGRGTEAVKA